MRNTLLRCSNASWKLFMASLALCFFNTVSGDDLDGIRVWKSWSGNTIEARALGVDGERVSLEQPDGQKIVVSIDVFDREGRELLERRFLTAEGAGDFHVPVGRITGPVSSGDYSYFIYIPKSLRLDREAPLLYFTNAGGGSAGVLNRLVEGAELAGWIVMCSVESKNGLDWSLYEAHLEENLKHVKENIPLIGNRIYYSGISGGSRVAFHHSNKNNGAGVLGIIAGTPGSLVPPDGAHYYLMTGARDYNRYEMALVHRQTQRHSAYRFHPGGHNAGPDWLVTEGVAWLEWRHQQRQHGAARDWYERQLAAWINGLTRSNPHRALYWCRLLLGTGFNRYRNDMQRLREHLETDPLNVLYVDGIVEIEQIAREIISNGPQHYPAVINHRQDELVRKIESIENKYQDSPWIPDLLKNLKEQTVR